MTPVNIKSNGVHHITLRSLDLSRSRNFYVNLLGFPILLEKDDLLIVRVGNFALAIRDRGEGTPEDDRFNPFRVGLDHIALASSGVDEIKRVAGALKANGIWTEGPKTDDTLGKTYVAFKDPDGIKLELYEV